MNSLKALRTAYRLAKLTRPVEDVCPYLKILDKQQQLIPYVPNAIQQHYLAHRTGRDLILKPRQVGISTCIQAAMFQSAITKTVMGATLAHDDETTQKLRRMAARFYDNLPERLRPKRTLNNASTTGYSTTGSEIMIATAGNTSGGRGGTYSDLHGSEVAYWKDAAELIAGIMQGIPLHGSIQLESTGNGAQGWFYDECMAALEGKSQFTLHFYPWWQQPEYQIPLAEGEAFSYSDDEQFLVDRHGLTPEQINWRRFKSAELKEKFPQEYPEDPLTCFLVSGNGYFGDVSGCFTAPLTAQPEADKRYVGGLDFAQLNDYTALIILDTERKRMVDMLHINRLSWGDQRAEISRMAFKWDNAVIHAESNSIGSVNIEQLRNDGVRVAPFETTAQSKPPLIQGLKYALTDGGLTLQPYPVLKNELQTFISRQIQSGAWVYEAQGSAHDDCVMALALAWHGCVTGRLTMPIFVR